MVDGRRGGDGLGCCFSRIVAGGQSGRLVLALLVLCWSLNTQFAVAGPAAILALCFHFGASRFAPGLTPKLVPCTWIFTVVTAVIWKVRLLAYPWHFSMEAPAGHGNFELLIVRGYLV